MHTYPQSTFLQKGGFNDNMNGTMTETTLCDVTQGTETFAHIYQCSDNIQNQGPVALWSSRQDPHGGFGMEAFSDGGCKQRAKQASCKANDEVSLCD